MPRGYRYAILAAVGWLAGQGEQIRAAKQKQSYEYAPAQPSPIEQSPDANRAQAAQKPCYPEADPHITCDGIAAKAAVDQALDADKGAAASWWQLGVGVGTLLAAVAATYFAWRAVGEGKKSAINEYRAWLIFDHIKVNEVSEEWSNFTVKIRNTGQHPARFLAGARLSGCFGNGRPEGFDPFSINYAESLIAPNETRELTIYTEWESRSVPPPKLYCWINYWDGVSNIRRVTEQISWIGSEIIGEGITNLQFNQRGSATGIAKTLWQEMT